MGIPGSPLSHVYVSCAEAGEIRLYALHPGRGLEQRGAFAAEKGLGPLAVSPDRRLLVGAARTKPFKVHCYAIVESGALRGLGTAALAESLPYIAFDRTGRYLLGASYGGHLVSVNPVGADGRVGDPMQVIPTARNAHAIITDRTNRYVFVPHLGTDQVFQFRLDEKTGRLSANTPPVLQLKAGTGPRHLVQSPDGRFIYLLNELTATVATLALDAQTGLLSEVSVASAVPPDIKLGPGAPRPNDRDKEKDIWASDIHVTPDGRFVYAAERTSSTINTLSVAPDGKLTYLGSTPTEKQPRGFGIDPTGRTMIVTGEKSDTISAYAIDPASGALKLTGQYPTGKGANWVEIVSFD
ncbi:MAG TPA: beta-propeller fold lactonase family protein [Burkholderiales bacterium]|nr:beta-propeller fold lactonase family protein [Burkholderiales bacterium]